MSFEFDVENPFSAEQLQSETPEEASDSMGLEVEQFFSTPGVHPFEQLEPRHRGQCSDRGVASYPRGVGSVPRIRGVGPGGPPRQPGGEDPLHEGDVATETRRKGPVNPRHETGMLTRLYRFEGPAYYQRTFTVPDDWADKRITLTLERTKWTRVWLDGHGC